MDFIKVSISESVAEIVLDRPKVNALNEHFLEELHQSLKSLSGDSKVKALILTAEGSFFSFGFDVPGLYKYPKKAFTEFMFKFSSLLKYIFLFPKPIIAALNGHTIAAGGLVALACDYRVMVTDKAKISLNEITFGSSLFTSAVEILKFIVGAKNASLILYSGQMFTGEDAIQLGLIDKLVSKEELKDTARSIARDFANNDSNAFKTIKLLLRNEAANEIENSEKDSILEFVNIWYSKPTRKNLQKIKIHD